jgi:hypothetical protein
VGGGETVGAAESVGNGEMVGSGEGVAVGSLVQIGVEVEVSVAVGVAVEVGAGELVGAGTGVEMSDCGTGFGCTAQSEVLSFESTQLPSMPPGRRSRLDRAGGAGTTEPSTYELVAVPQPTASITVPATYRRASDPPSLARPPV